MLCLAIVTPIHTSAIGFPRKYLRICKLAHGPYNSTSLKPPKLVGGPNRLSFTVLLWMLRIQNTKTRGRPLVSGPHSRLPSLLWYVYLFQVGGDVLSVVPKLSTKKSSCATSDEGCTLGLPLNAPWLCPLAESPRSRAYGVLPSWLSNTWMYIMLHLWKRKCHYFEGILLPPNIYIFYNIYIYD